MEIALALVLHALASMLLHEGGHALAGVLVGARPRGLMLRGGMKTLLDTPRAGWTRGSLSAVMAGGIVVNVLSAVVLAQFSLVMWMPHVLCAVANLVPTAGSDGRALWLISVGRMDDVVTGYSLGSGAECRSTTPARMNT